VLVIVTGVIVTGVIVTLMVVVVGMGALVCGFKGNLGGVRLRGSFDGVGRAQRFTFQAHCAKQTA